MTNGSVRTAGFILSVVVLFGSGLLAWGDVKNKANTNEKNHKEFKQETKVDIKDIKTSQQTMLVQQTNLTKDVSYLISMVEDLKKTN